MYVLVVVNLWFYGWVCKKIWTIFFAAFIVTMYKSKRTMFYLLKIGFCKVQKSALSLEEVSFAFVLTFIMSNLRYMV